MLSCFEYIKRYHIDMFDSMGIMLELLILKEKDYDFIKECIRLAVRRRLVFSDVIERIQKYTGKDLFIQINPKLNLVKVLRNITESDTDNANFEEFIHIITQKKTTNKLYCYSTPLEINELLMRLLDVRAGESVYNPCFGIGTFFLMLSRLVKNGVEIYGEELDSRLAKIAKLIARLANFDDKNLVVNDILKAPYFENKFDKIICYPPFDAYIGAQYLKDDKRFKGILGLTKNYVEWVFLLHVLYHFKKCAIFVLRTHILQKLSLENEFIQLFYKRHLINTIIELPKNIFPHQNNDFCILVLSPNNREILSIDAKGARFCKKDGKYNRLLYVDEIIEVFNTRKDSAFSFRTAYEEIDSLNPIPLPFSASKRGENEGVSLEELGVKIIRGQRVYGGKNDVKIDYFDVGLADFAEYGFSKNLHTKRLFGDREKIYKFALKPYDVCLSMRGSLPKVTIFDEEIKNKIALVNTGILTLRAPDRIHAIGIYCFFYSHKGQSALKGLCEYGAIDIELLRELRLPKDFLIGAEQKFNMICKYFKTYNGAKIKLEALR